jgi:deoxyguanosine kinase
MRKCYISFESVIGTGKTVLTEKLSNHLQSETMYEIVEENPFLEKFYQDPEHWSFQTECFFLCNRYMQLKKIKKMLEEDKKIVSDYHILKNLIFAQITLEKEELKKYKKLFKIMVEDFELPNIIIYSEASLKEIQRRINKRGREMEKEISPDYLNKLIEAYKKVMNPENIQKYYPGTQLIKIDADKIDFIKQPKRLEDLYEMVNNAKEDQHLLYQELN